MTWSIQSIGKASAVRSDIADQVSRINCAEPEASILANTAKSIDLALESFPASYAVKVTASGSQFSPASDGSMVNQLSLTIEPIYGFKE